MSQVKPPIFDVPIYNPSNYEQTTTTTGIQILQPVTPNGITYYSDGNLNTNSNIVVSPTNLSVGTKLDVTGDVNIALGSDSTRIVGISGFASGKTGIFRFADSANQLETTHGGTLKVRGYHGIQFYNNGTNEIVRLGTTFNSSNCQFNGLVGIGMNPSFQLQLSTADAYKSTGSSWSNPSDERIKDDIQLANLDTCYDVVKNIPLKRYGYKPNIFEDGQIRDTHRLGWIAQDIEKTFPKAVTQTNLFGLEDCRVIDVDQLYASMYGCIQKLINETETMRNEINNLKAEIEILKNTQ